MIAATMLALAFAGLALISLSMDRHARQTAMRVRRWMRPAGWLCLGLSLVLVAIAPNWRFALIEWIGLAALAGALVVAVLHVRATILAPLILLAGSAALLLILVAIVAGI